MFYFYDNQQKQWITGTNVAFPDGEKLHKNKKKPNNQNENHKKDFVWYDEPPQAYLDWLEELNNQ